MTEGKYIWAVAVTGTRRAHLIRPGTVAPIAVCGARGVPPWRATGDDDIQHCLRCVTFTTPAPPETDPAR